MPSLFSSEVLDSLSLHATAPAAIAEAQTAQRELLLRRGRYLAEPDRRLLTLALKHRLSVREIAPLVGLNHGSVARRVQQLKRKLCDPLIVSLVDPRCPLAQLDRELALDHHLRGRSQRSIALLHNLPPREVRRRLLYVRGWISGRREGARITRALLQTNR